MAETMNLQADTAPETITLQVPGQLYARAKQAAGQDQQSLEQLLVSAMTSGLSLLNDLPDDIVLDMATLALLNDRALWRVARQTMTDDHYQTMDPLLSIKKQRKLSADQEQELKNYLAEYDMVILQRAHAAVLLKQRGYDLSDPKVLTDPVSVLV